MGKTDTKVRLSVALDEDIGQRLETCANRVKGASKHSLMLAAVESAVVAIENHDGRLVMPIEFTVNYVPVAVSPEVATEEQRDKREISVGTMIPNHLIPVPVYGEIPAGPPSTWVGQLQPLEYRLVDRNQKRGKVDFALRVTGDSMTKAGIEDGAVALFSIAPDHKAKPGQIVAALVDGETTLKRLRQDKEAGTYYLESHSDNPVHKIIRPEAELVIQGIYVSVIKEGDKPSDEGP